jgi:hypothetical protein
MVKKDKNEKLSMRTIVYLKEQRHKEQEENFNNKYGCRLTNCKKCGKEFYFSGKKAPICSECKKAKEHDKLIKEQIRLAKELGLM